VLGVKLEKRKEERKWKEVEEGRKGIENSELENVV
jgi:hypothetical protein